MKKGAALIAEERIRQIGGELFGSKHDDNHVNRELIRAAVCYCEADNLPQTENEDGEDLIECGYWPWDKEYWKPTPNDRIRELTKAGALIAAEIDRLQRINKTPEPDKAPLAQ